MKRVPGEILEETVVFVGAMLGRSWRRLWSGEILEETMVFVGAKLGRSWRRLWSSWVLS